MGITKTNTPPYYKLEGNVGTYKASLTQTGTAAPIATVLVNTIGEIVWTRATTGTYIATLEGAFPPEKTTIIIGANMMSSLNALFRGGNEDQPNQVFIKTMDSSFAGQDDYAKELCIEITVYP